MSPRRTRRGTIIPDIACPSTEKKGRRIAASPKEKSLPPPKRRNTRAAKSKVTSDSEENQSRNVSKKSSRKRPAKSEADSLITEDDSITESPRRVRPSSRLENNSLISDDESTPSRRSAGRASTTRVDTTPKSSPISVHLSPHRSKKTPRRSPVNFGSPKTHSYTPLRLSKTPRKLEIDETPPSSEDSQQAKKNEGRSILKSPSSRSKPKSPSPKKSPKQSAVKRSRRVAAKSKKSPSPKKVTKEESSPSTINQSVSSVSKKIVSPKSRRSTSASKVKKSPVKLRGSSKNRSSMNMSDAFVMVERLGNSGVSKKSTPSEKKTPPPSPRRPKLVAKKRIAVTDSGTPLRPLPAPKKPRSSLKKIILEKQTKGVSPYELKALQDSSGFIASTPREKTRRSLNLSDSLDISTPLIRKKSSTPLTKKKSSPIVRKKSLSPLKKKSPSSLKKKSPSPIKKVSPSPIKRKSSSLLDKKKSLSPKTKSRSFVGIDDESEPGMSDTSLINMSDVFDSDVSQKEEKKDKDGTYELLEPKTPILQAKKLKKRTSMEANLSWTEIESKKVCKVRFADNNVMSNVMSNVTNSSVTKLRSGTPGHKLSLKRTSEVRSKSRSPQRLNKGLSDSTRRRSSSVSVIEGTPRTPNNKRRINSVATSNLKAESKAQLASVNRLSRPRMSVTSEKKTDSKTPVPRKIPNFAEIHKKNFNKMESIIDAKKRVVERHVALVNPLVTSTTKSVPEVALGKFTESTKLPTTSEFVNGAYTRFGFKVRRNETVQSIAKKQSTMTSEKKKNARREILKGVRTNRRFELQMKARKSLGSQ